MVPGWQTAKPVIWNLRSDSHSRLLCLKDHSDSEVRCQNLIVVASESMKAAAKRPAPHFPKLPCSVFYILKVNPNSALTVSRIPTEWLVLHTSRQKFTRNTAVFCCCSTSLLRRSSHCGVIYLRMVLWGLESSADVASAILISRLSASILETRQTVLYLTHLPINFLLGKASRLDKMTNIRKTTTWQIPLARNKRGLLFNATC